MKEIAEIIKEMILILREPATVILFLMVVALIYIVWHKDRCLTQITKEHNLQLSEVSEKLVGQINRLALTIERQVALLEVLTYRSKR